MDLLGRYSNHDSLTEKLTRALTTPRQGTSRTPPRPKQHQHRLQADELARLVRAFQRGTSLKDLAVMFRIHKTTVAAHLDRQGPDEPTPWIRR